MDKHTGFRHVQHSLFVGTGCVEQISFGTLRSQHFSVQRGSWSSPDCQDACFLVVSSFSGLAQNHHHIFASHHFLFEMLDLVGVFSVLTSTFIDRTRCAGAAPVNDTAWRVNISVGDLNPAVFHQKECGTPTSGELRTLQVLRSSTSDLDDACDCGG